MLPSSTDLSLPSLGLSPHACHQQHPVQLSYGLLGSAWHAGPGEQWNTGSHSRLASNSAGSRRRKSRRMDVLDKEKAGLSPSRWCTQLVVAYRSQCCGTYEEEGVKAGRYSLVERLKACASLRDLEGGTKIHAHVIQSGVEADVYLGTALVDMYSKCGAMLDARLLFDKLPHRNVASWNVIILGYAHKEAESEVALQLYAQMQQEGLAPNARTYVSVLKAICGLATLEEGDGKMVKVRCLEKGRCIHSQAVPHLNMFLENTLIDMYAKCGSMADAVHVFHSMPHRDVVSWTTIILGYAHEEEAEVALKLYALMRQQGVAPNDRTYVAALKACACLAAEEEGTQVDGKTVKVRSLEKGTSIHSQSVKDGFESDAFVGNTLMDMYVECGSMVDARRVFDKMPHPDVVSWNIMLLGYAEQGECGQAFQLFAQMQQQQCSAPANSTTLVSFLKACANAAALDAGKRIHAHIVGRGGMAVTDVFVANALVDMYGKCGSMAEAQQVFDALGPSCDLVTWNSLIAGYANQGNFDVVFNLFHKMEQQQGIEPNGFTFLSVLTVCSHAGLVNLAHHYFQLMRSKRYAISPSVAHYSCMVDLLGRAGQMDRLLGMVEEMPFQPDLRMWTSVLGACKKWSDVNLGRHAFEQAVKLDQQHSAPYVLMSNIYADAHMWEERDIIHAMRSNVGAWKKQPGCSWWNGIDGLVHSFVVGDTKHPHSKHIYAKLTHLSQALKGKELPVACGQDIGEQTHV